MVEKIIASEEDEQTAFVQWCRLQGFKVHHSPNEIGGSTWAVKARAIKMKKLGTSKGFPDLLVFLPIKDCYDKVGTYQPLAIEMKRTKGSTTSPEQKEWGKVFELAGIPFKVCKGCEEAMKFVRQKQFEIGYGVGDGTEF